MYESALRDGLTKAFNKKYFTDRLESEFTFSSRHVAPLALVLFDIDHFKKVNDTHGHQAGDHVLSEISTLLTGALRAEDVFARYGGEEFALVLPDTGPGEATAVAERVRRLVEAGPFYYNGAECRVTVSLGVATWPGGAAGRQEFLRLADGRLYQAKGRGRNCVQA